MDKQQAIKQALEQVRELAKKYNVTVVLKKYLHDIELVNPLNKEEIQSFKNTFWKSNMNPSDKDIVTFEQYPKIIARRIENISGTNQKKDNLK